MRLLFPDQLGTEPGTVLGWTVTTTSEPTYSPVPPDPNQLRHRADGRTSWLAGMFDVPGPIDRFALEIAFATWISRHDALQCCFAAARAGRPAATRVVALADIRLEARPDVQVATSDELRSVLGKRLDTACDPFRFAPYSLDAVSRTDRSTVVCGFDHAICDAWSITIATTELNELYRAAHDGGMLALMTAAAGLPEAGSFLSYRTRQSAAPQLFPGDPQLGAWLEFLRGAGCDLPHFPIDLALQPGSPAQVGGDVRSVLDAEGARRLQQRCGIEGYSMFGALLASVGLTSSTACGRARTPMLFPVHTRREARHHNTFGWLVSYAPANIAAMGDFAATARAADEAIRKGRRLASACATQVLEAMGPELTQAGTDAFTVSYADYRNLPGGQRSDDCLPRPANPTQLSWSDRVDDVHMWFTRSEDGIALRTRFPDTAVGRPLIHEFLDKTCASLAGLC